MFRRAWFCYAVAVLATVAACVLWLLVFSELRDSPSRSRDAVAPAFTVSTVSSTVVHSAPPVPDPLKTACVNGEAWAYFPDQRDWVRLRPVVPCDVRTGRLLPRARR